MSPGKDNAADDEVVAEAIVEIADIADVQVHEIKRGRAVRERSSGGGRIEGNVDPGRARTAWEPA